MNGINHQNMNKNNKHILLKEIITQGPITRGELCKKSSLSKMAITAIVNEFIGGGIVRECGSASSSSGRKSTLLEIVPDSLLSLSVSIGRDMLEAGIINLKGQVLCSHSVAFYTLKNNESFLKNLFLLCDRLAGTQYFKNVWGIGISSAGPLSIRDGMILEPPNFNSIKNLPITEELTKRYKLPTYLQNDMCLAALAELYFGNVKEHDNFIFVGVSSGIGGGVIIDKQLYTGSNGLAGAIGHSIVERNGIQCECGQKGCLEKYSSTRSVLQWAKEHGADESLTWIELTQKAAEGDCICLEAINRMIDYLAVAVVNIEAAYDTECVVIGGELHFCRELVTERISQSLSRKSASWGVNKRVRVKPASFIGNASFVGTVALLLEKMYEETDGAYVR